MTSWPKVGRASARLFRGKHARIQGGLQPALLLALAFAPVAQAEGTFFAQRVAPILEQKCVVCHGAEKQKGKLRLDSFAHLLRGGEAGAAVKAGEPRESELFIRVTLHPEDEDFMPADSKPPLTKDELKVLELWIAAGASELIPLSAIKGAPTLAAAKAPLVALAPDWHPRAAQIAQLEKALGLRLVPRSQVPTDGLILRTASAPTRCDDAALAKLAPVADLIVEAELARTGITDSALTSIAAWANLRAIDLTRTGVTSAGLGKLATSTKLESINLTSTGVDPTTVARLRTLPALKNLWAFDTPAEK